jgi:hypothetical protein
VGGIVGLLFAVPVLLVCDGCLLLALHRSQAIADRSRRVKWFCYLALFLVAGAVFVWVGNLVKQNAHAFAQELEAQISAGVIAALGKKPDVLPARPTPPSSTTPKPGATTKPFLIDSEIRTRTLTKTIGAPGSTPCITLQVAQRSSL